jgi:hypothetical protein
MSKHVTQMAIDDAQHYTPEQRKAIIDSYPEHEREARTRGVPSLGSGRVFPILEKAILCDPFTIPKEWFQIVGMDFGWDHPFAATRNAWDKDDPVLDFLAVAWQYPFNRRVRAMATKKPIHQLTVAQFEKAFPDEEACCAYLVGKRWPKGVRCPRCGAENPTELKHNPWHWQCYQCAPQSSYRFSHITGTIFENTKKPLRDWFRVIHLMLTSKKGISARQLHRYMGFGSYGTAWYMAHRVRSALAKEPVAKLGGIVEVDETFVGGLAKNRHWDKRGGGGGTGGVGSGKTPIVGAVSRKGNAVCRVIENVRASTLIGFVNEAVSTKALH